MSKRRMTELEDCCKTLTNISNRQITNEEVMSNTLTSIKDNLHRHILNFEKHDREEGEKYKSIETNISTMNSKVNKRINEIEKRIYLVTGAIGVLMFLSKFMNFGITVTQG